MNQKIEQLKEKLADTHGEERVGLLNNIAYEYYPSQPEKTESYAREALALALELKFTRGIIESYQRLGISFAARGDYKQAYDYLTRSLDEYIHTGDEAGIAATCSNLGGILWRQREYAESMQYYQIALEIYEKLGNLHGVANSYNGIALYYDHRGDSALALKYLLKSLSIREITDDKKSLIVANINVGNFYFYQKEYEKALCYYLSAEVMSEELAELNQNVVSCNNVAAVYANLEEDERARKYLAKGIETAQRIGAKSEELMCYQTLKEFHTERCNFAELAQIQNKIDELITEISKPSP